MTIHAQYSSGTLRIASLVRLTADDPLLRMSRISPGSQVTGAIVVAMSPRLFRYFSGSLLQWLFRIQFLSYDA